MLPDRLNRTRTDTIRLLQHRPESPEIQWRDTQKITGSQVIAEATAFSATEAVARKA